MGRRELEATSFLRLVGVFLRDWALPYFAQRATLETINAHATARYMRAVERSLRLDPQAEEETEAKGAHGAHGRVR